MFNLSRRGFLRTTAAAVTVATLAAPALAADPIIIGIPASQSGPVGGADHQDWTNGAMMAIEEINAAWGGAGPSAGGQNHRP